MRYLSILLFMLSDMTVMAQTKPILLNHNKMSGIALGRHMDFLEHVEGATKFEDIVSGKLNSSFFSIDENIPNFNFTNRRYWGRFSINNTTDQNIKLLLEHRYCSYLFSVYKVEKGGVLVGQVGTRISEPRVVDFYSPVLPINITPGTNTFLIMLDWDRIKFSNFLWSEAEFFQYRGDMMLRWGLIFGALFIILAYNLALMLTRRNRHYFYYCCYLVSIILWLLYHTNISYVFGQDFQIFLSHIWHFLILSVGVFFVLMTENFLNLMSRRRLYFRILLWPMAFFAPVILIDVPLYMNMYIPFIAFVIFPIIMISCFYRIRTGERYIQFFTISILIFFTGTIIQAFAELGFITYIPEFEYAQALGVTLETAVISLAIGERLRRDLEKLSLSLEEKVVSQTKELVEKNNSLQNLDKQKTTFFQNMSHELRTPLTLILNPLEEAAKHNQNDKNIEVAMRNSRRLLRIVNQLLDFQKLSTGKQNLYLSPINIINFARICSDYFESTCKNRNITYHVKLNGEILEPDFHDETYINCNLDGLEKILFNFLSNALKFTPVGGIIELNIKEENDNVKLLVSDTGPGISDEGQKRLFKVFSQLDESTTREFEGTGLGLALARELA
ncbi:MAG: hypothetical protein CMP10_08085 [Zetaproteobacteria bacterium]|nr:hypothetical protein [Pseudobdellovibrionaceae bacterium]